MENQQKKIQVKTGILFLPGNTSIRTFIAFVLLFLFAQCTKKNGRFCETKENDEVVCMTYLKGSLREIETYMYQDTFTRNGPYYKFSLKGDTIVKGFYKDDKLRGGYYEYYKSDFPKKFICFDSYHEDTLFYREYNAQRAIIAERGSLFYDSGVKDDKLKTDSMLKVMSVVISPPLSNVNATCFAVWGESFDTLVPSKTYFEPLQNNLVLSHLMKFPKKGYYQVFTVVEVQDFLKDTILQKRNRFDVAWDIHDRPSVKFVW